MPITESDAEKIAQLARLELTPEETGSFTRQLGAILEHMNRLNELDTSGVEPMSHCITAAGDTDYTRRDDEVKPGLGQQRAIENAPDSDRGCFRVPKVIGG
jgi:aspartyl-tRNA(Asn)/glutamyl-tRNA(Gln) amidotransferase subunit C